MANPIATAEGERIGTVVEWRDRTDEVAVELQVNDVISAAAAGDFGKRLDTAHLTGFFAQIGDSINRLLEANSRALDDVAALLSRLSSGDLRDKIETEYQEFLVRSRTTPTRPWKTCARSLRRSGCNGGDQYGVGEIAHGNQDLSSRTEEQASALRNSLEHGTADRHGEAERRQRARPTIWRAAPSR